MAKPPERAEETLITSAVRPRKRKACDGRNASPVPTVVLCQLDSASIPAAHGRQVQSPSARRQAVAGVSKAVGSRSQIRPGALPSVPTPCQPPCLTPTRHRSAAADDTTHRTAAVGFLRATAATSGTASRPLTGPPPAQSRAASASGVQSPINSKSRREAAAKPVADGVAVSCKLSQHRKDHVAVGEEEGGASVATSTRLTAMLNLRDVSCQTSGAAATEAKEGVRDQYSGSAVGSAQEAALQGAAAAQRPSAGRGADTAIVEQREPHFLPHTEGGDGGDVGGAASATSSGSYLPQEARQICSGTTRLPLEERDLLASEEVMEDAEPGYPPGADLQTDEEPAEGDDEEAGGQYMEFDPYEFIRNLPPLSTLVPPARSVLLPRQTRACKRKKTLVLDLDETLVHSSLEGFSSSPDFSFMVYFNGQEHEVSVCRRPGLYDFLDACEELFEVVVFTASQKVYAEQLLNILDPERRYIRHRVFRDSCVLWDGTYLKDLTVLGRDLRHTVIIDNSPQAFGFQVTNGIPIDSWYDDADDKKLTDLLPLLRLLAAADDVRPLLMEEFQLEQKVAESIDYQEESRLPLGPEFDGEELADGTHYNDENQVCGTTV